MYFPSLDDPPILRCLHLDMALAREDTPPCHSACGLLYLGTLDTGMHDRRNDRLMSRPRSNRSDVLILGIGWNLSQISKPSLSTQRRSVQDGLKFSFNLQR